MSNNVMKGKSLPKWELSKCINAVKRGDIDFLRVYHNNVDPWDKYGLSYKWGMPFICTTAVKFGQLEILKYLHENRFPWNEETFNEAISSKRELEYLDYLYENKCPWNESTFVEAAYKGGLNYVKYLYEHKCPWNEYTFKVAIWSGLNYVKYLYERNCPINHENILDIIEGDQNFNILKYLVNSGYKISKWNLKPCLNGVRKGDIEFLKNYHKNFDDLSYKFNVPIICTTAVKCRKMEVLKYLHENKFPWDEETFKEGISQGIGYVEYLYENKCPWNEETFNYAIHKNLDFVRYLYDRKCPMNKDKVIEIIVTEKYFNILKYFVDVGYPILNEKIFSSFSYNLEYIKYLHENKCPWDESVTYRASENIECLKYLHENGYPWNKRSYVNAIKINNFECVKYLYDNGCQWNEDAISTASYCDHFDIFKYLHLNGCPIDKRVVTYGIGKSYVYAIENKFIGYEKYVSKLQCKT